VYVPVFPVKCLLYVIYIAESSIIYILSVTILVITMLCPIYVIMSVKVCDNHLMKEMEMYNHGVRKYGSTLSAEMKYLMQWLKHAASSWNALAMIWLKCNPSAVEVLSGVAHRQWRRNKYNNVTGWEIFKIINNAGYWYVPSMAHPHAMWREASSVIKSAWLAEKWLGREVTLLSVTK